VTQISERANTAYRTIPLCGENFLAPDYLSYNAAGSGNIYKPYFSYKYKNPNTCASYSWQIISSDTKPDNKDYATEHVYELQLINIFFEWMSKNDAGIKDRLKNGKVDMCSGVIRPLLIPTTQWTNAKFGAGGSMTTVGSRPIDDLICQLSGGSPVLSRPK
jgi:hypothetical protein